MSEQTTEIRWMDDAKGEKASEEAEEESTSYPSSTDEDGETPTDPGLEAQTVRPQETLEDLDAYASITRQLQESIVTPATVTRRSFESVLLSGTQGCGQTQVAKALLGSLGDAGFRNFRVSETLVRSVSEASVIDCLDAVANSARETDAAAIYLQNLEQLFDLGESDNDILYGHLRRFLRELEASRTSVVVVASLSSEIAPSHLLFETGHFEEHMSLSTPNRSRRQTILQNTMADVTRGDPSVKIDVDFDSVSALTAGWTHSELELLAYGVYWTVTADKPEAWEENPTVVRTAHFESEISAMQLEQSQQECREKLR